MKYFGGVVAVANIRGGSEYGEEWHKAAVKMKRQNALYVKWPENNLLTGAQ